MLFKIVPGLQDRMVESDTDGEIERIAEMVKFRLHSLTFTLNRHINRFNVESLAPDQTIRRV